MVAGVFASLVRVLERSILPVPKGATHHSPLAKNLLQIISTLISQGSKM